MYLNKVMLIGNLTRDPEMKAIPSGAKVTTFSLATTKTWKGTDGSRKEATEFHNCVAWEKAAELIAQYCKKGSSLYVDGRLQTRSWEQDGQKKYRTEIVVENFQFGPKAGGASTGAPAAGSSAAPKTSKEEEGGGLDTIEYPEEESNPEDIPF